MIHKLSFSNFNSFKNEVVIDFVVDKNAPNTDSYFADSYENRISKVMTVVGANASGKTNLLKSLVFLKWFIIDSFSSLTAKHDIVGFFPFLFCSEDKKTTFDIVFEIVDEIFEYKLELTKKNIIHESLEVMNKNSNRMNIVFDRNLVDGKEEYETRHEKMELPSDFDKMLRLNSSLLSTAKQINNLYALKIVEYFARIQSNIEEISGSENVDQSMVNATKFFHEKPDMKNKAEKILQHFDLGLSKFSIKEFRKQDGSPVFIPFAFHKHSDSEKEGSLPMISESGGTKNLFVLLKDMLLALETGNIVVFDELDNNLHPLMIPEIINLFKSKNYNPKNAQIFFSTHNVQILNELDKQQIIIVEKNENNISESWSLNDVEGVRNDENYYSKYLAGVYGGIPRF